MAVGAGDPGDDAWLVAYLVMITFPVTFGRFNRSHYDAERGFQGFTGSLQGRADSERIVEGWVGVVSETMQPSLVAIWVREGK